jgi:hypothetical protein
MPDRSSSGRPPLEPAHLRAEQARLLHRAESLEAHRLGLDRAIESFGGTTMDPERWRQAFLSNDPDDIVARSGLTGCYSALVNGYIELIKSGAYLAGLTPHKKDRAKNSIDIMLESGGVTESQAEVLHVLYAFEGRVQHASPDIDADEIREAVELLRTHSATLIASAIRWLGDDGVAVISS